MTVIAMTREIGSLGTEVATGLADRLGLKIIHSEIVANNIAERLGVEERALLRYVDGSASFSSDGKSIERSYLVTRPRRYWAWLSRATYSSAAGEPLHCFAIWRRSSACGCARQ
jgi:hypothetical protein